MYPQMIELIKTHLQRYPLAEVVDIYKLLYQTANGPKHLVMMGIDENDFFEEWNNADAQNNPPIESLSVDGQLVRAHFGPLRRMNVSPAQVLSALYFTARSFAPNPELMIDWWKDLGELIEAGALELSLRQYAELDEDFLQFGFTAKHHSEAFVAEYKPAYFVIMRRIIEPFMQNVKTI